MVSQEKRGGGTIAFQDAKLWGSLSKTDLLVAPPGHSRVDAQRLIKDTHKVIHDRLPKVAGSTKSAATKNAPRKPVKKAAPRKRATKSSKSRTAKR
jgi:hypothetical protein